MENVTDNKLKVSNRNPNPQLKSAASCRACDTHITFKKLETGRSIPLEDDSNICRCVEWKSWRADNE
jgi:hypothetical protein